MILKEPASLTQLAEACQAGEDSIVHHPPLPVIPPLGNEMLINDHWHLEPAHVSLRRGYQ